MTGDAAVLTAEARFPYGARWAEEPLRSSVKIQGDGRTASVELQGPAGRLEGLYDLPEGPVRAAAVVCHPHPLHEGTMRNTIVYRAARALRGAGIATLRVNFRGVEGSEGEHDGNGAEEGDVSVALDFLAERHPGRPLWGAGYSFGSRTVAGLATHQERIARVILIAFPISAYDCSFLTDVGQPGLLVFGGGDPYGTLTELAQQFPSLPERFALEEVPGADHFFKGRTPLLEQAIHDYALEAIEHDDPSDSRSRNA